MAISGDTALVGAYKKEGIPGVRTGVVYLFVRSGTSWTQRARLIARDAATVAKFGSGVAVAGKYAVVGDYTAKVDGQGGAGQAYVYNFKIKDRSEACQKDADCLNLTCYDGVCCRSTCAQSCRACNLAGGLGTCAARAWGVQVTSGANTCSGIKACDGTGECKKKLGQVCAANAECVPGDIKISKAGSCVDGVCCHKTACKTCESCSQAGSPGQCKQISINKTDDVPAGSCSGKYACDGQGKCKEGFGRGCANDSVCASDICTDGVCCDSTCLATCSSCAVPGKLGSCNAIPSGPDLGCTGVCQSCVKGACAPLTLGTQVTSGGQKCSGGFECDGSGACKKTVGQACGNGLECASNHCKDGVCCETACDKSCESCGLPGAKGKCTLIKATEDPDKECIGGHPQCGGSCDGKGQCGYPKQGSWCGACKACDGTGRCSVTPPDDAKGCGTIDCDRLDTRCRDYKDVTTARCFSFGACKPANDQQTCTSYTDLPCVDAGSADQGKAPDQGPGLVTGGDEESGCEMAAGGAGATQRVPALAALMLVLVWGRRRRTDPVD